MPITRQSNFAPYLVSQPLGGPANIDVFVDSVAGSDLNPGTAALPLATVSAVYRNYPLSAISGAFVTINLVGDGTNVIDYPVRTLVVNGGDAAQNAYRYRGPQMVLATLASGLDTVVGGLTPAVSGRRTTITVAPNPGWTVNDLRGRYLRVTRAGEKVVFEIPICANTANVVTVDDEKLSPLVQATDTIEIVTWGARFVSDTPTLQILITGNAGYVPSPYFWGAVDESATFERIFFGDFPLAMQVGGLTLDRCGMDNFPFIKGGSIAHFNCIYPLGLKVSSMSTEFGISGRPDSPTDPINTTVAMELLVLAGQFLIGNPDGIGQYMAKRNVSVYDTTNAARGAIHVVGMGSMFWADDGSLAPNGAVALGGSNNAGPFIWAIHGGQVRINTTAGASPPTYGTGTGNPLRVCAAGAAVAYGTGVGAYEQVIGFNGNFTRVFAGTTAAPTGDASRIFTPQ